MSKNIKFVSIFAISGLCISLIVLKLTAAGSPLSLLNFFPFIAGFFVAVMLSGNPHSPPDLAFIPPFSIFALLQWLAIGYLISKVLNAASTKKSNNAA